MTTSKNILFKALDTITHNALTDALEAPGQHVRVELAEIDGKIYAEMASCDVSDVSRPREGIAYFRKDQIERYIAALQPVHVTAA